MPGSLIGGALHVSLCAATAATPAKRIAQASQTSLREHATSRSFANRRTRKEPLSICCSPPDYLLPLQELRKQSLAFTARQRTITRRICPRVQERVEPSSDLRWAPARICRHLGKKLFSHAVSRPAWNLAGEVDLSPFGLERRLLQLIELSEVSFNEAGDTTVALAALRPVEHCQDSRHGNRRHSLASLDEIGIVPRFQKSPERSSLRTERRTRPG